MRRLSQGRCRILVLPSATPVISSGHPGWRVSALCTILIGLSRNSQVEFRQQARVLFKGLRAAGGVVSIRSPEASPP